MLKESPQWLAPQLELGRHSIKLWFGHEARNPSYPLALGM